MSSNHDDDDGLFDENDDSSDEEVAVVRKSSKKRKGNDKSGGEKKKPKQSWIDDAAEESGDEGGDDDDEEDDDENENDYIKDDFVVGEDEVEFKKKQKTGDLEDSDDDDEDDDDDDTGGRKLSKKKRVKKKRNNLELAEEDLDLIAEARGDTERDSKRREREEAARKTVFGRDQDELQKGLFYDSGDDGAAATAAQSKQTKRRMVEQFDEDGMDDFIDDDLNDQSQIMASARSDAYDDEGAGVSEAQLNEASEIFGTDYLEFMANEDQNMDEEEELGGKYRERGVGVDLLDSDESSDEDDDDDDDLFGDDDRGGDSVQASQKREALKLKREKKELARQERRKQKLQQKNAKRKAQLRRAFEPVQLIENFCTDRDDEIRRLDAPERFFDWKSHFHGSPDGGDPTEEEEEEAMWIIGRIPEIASEYFAPTQNMEEMEEREKRVMNSIVQALRLLHVDKLEPAFIKRYREDQVASPAVRENLYRIMDEDDEYNTMVTARTKVGEILESVIRDVDHIEARGAEADFVKKLELDLMNAEEKLEEAAKQESQLKTEIEQLDSTDAVDDDDDDELFGDDDDNDNEAKKEKQETLKKHLSTIQALMEDRAEKVTDVQTKLASAQATSRESMQDQGPAQEVMRKTCRESLWNAEDIVDYLSGLTDMRHAVDLNMYLSLIKEGNDAIRKKEMPMLSQSDKTKDGRKKSRRFDRDFYRTCVSEGLRSICYKFLLPPNRVGIKIEDMSQSQNFDFNKAMPGEQNPSPQNWVAPMLESQSPDEFANDLIGSGELILLSSSGGTDPGDQETSDPLRGCRYVAAMELAHEPRVRRHLRNIYRRYAVLTTRPTKKGNEIIDAFHDYYGLHLIKDKGVKEHFPMDEKEAAEKKAMLGPDECRELDREMKKREHESCLQYLRILKAEHTGHISVHVHLPLKEQFDDWYTHEEQYATRDKQDIGALMEELERVYFPLDGDTEEWNDERRKILTQALIQFLLPRFEGEIRRELKEACMRIGVEAAGENLYNLAMEGPYRPQALMHTENRFLYPTGDLPMVGICCSADPKEPTYLASVTERGAFNDHLAIPGGTRVDSGKNREKVITFLLQSRPAAVLVGTSGGFESRILHRKMNDLISEAMQRWKDKDIQGEDEDDEDYESRRASLDKLRYEDDEDEEWTCNADLIDDNVAQLFGRSVRAKKEFPDHQTNLKIAVSIARYAKDPLGELTYAWSVASDTGNFGAELLYINIHPMQQQLPRTLLLRQYERTLCEVVAAIGVDVNAACSLDHLQGLLSFVPGFGPRKAASLKQSVEQLGETIGSRRFLLEKRLMGPIVYNNAVAFLRIRNVDVDDGHIMNPLDDTRLHPDVYTRHNWAIKIATDALERAEDETRNKERASIKALRDVMDNSAQEVERLFLATKEEWEALYGPTFKVFEWNPKVSVPSDKWRDKVEELDLDAFAGMIEESGHGKWNSHLQMIKWEFRLPYSDPRAPMEPLTGDKLFKLITGESDQSLRPGKEVTGKVMRNGDFGSRVKLEGDIPAFIPLRNLSDEHVETAEDIVSIGMVVTAVITEVKKDHMCVDMSLKMEDFKKKPSAWDRPATLPPLDDHFDWRASHSVEEKKSKEREARLEAQQLSLGHTNVGEDGAPKKRAGRIARRACAHPAFRNSRHDEVDKELKEGGAAMVGEALVRPSSKSSDSLAVHWVVQEGSIKVVEVIEEDKDNDAAIGNILKIKDETYGSIDELLGRYVAPMNDYVEELMSHRKFADMPEDELDEKLRKEKTANPKGIFYNICWMEMHPGYASLRFILSSTTRAHPIGISPNGFVWGTIKYPNLDKLLNDFKKNPRGSSTGKRTASSSGAQSQKPTEPRASRWGSRPPPPSAPPPSWGSQSAAQPAPAQQWGAASATAQGQWDRPPPPAAGYGQPPPPSYGPPPGGPPPYSRPPAPPNYPPGM
ncbi:unnamed protein product [Cylindrotheca closterium]|uniref:S1 motif domain-containing protein n=1 Tax=Cylindrotheca closterium TaxID=2856 RepID=A0AAD2FKS5_9STRA|nr:unnamed protein product [Cylindrotheca closterium]